MVRLILPLLMLLLVAASCKPKPIATEPVKQYGLHGTVVRLEADHRIAVIKHDKIGDWMDAMTMEFPVKEPADFQKLRAGQEITATVNVQGFDFWLTGVLPKP